MRDKRFVVEHRGGILKTEQHSLIISWACDCAEHVLILFGEEIDERLIHALRLGKEWKNGNTSVVDARKASFRAIKVANESTNPVNIAVARSVGHAVATAHMADHSLVAALYALKAVKISGNSIDAEIKWQNDQLPIEIRDLVISTRGEKKKL